MNSCPGCVALEREAMAALADCERFGDLIEDLTSYVAPLTDDPVAREVTLRIARALVDLIGDAS